MGIIILVLFVIFMAVLYQKKMFENKSKLFSLEKQHQEELLRAAIEIAEHERQKTATNIHDEIGLILNVTKLNMELIQRKIDKPEAIGPIAARSIESINTSIELVRNISRDMAPMTLRKRGIVLALGEICRNLSETSSLNVLFNCDEQQIEMNPDKELQLYRLLKEIINNTVKHGAPAYMEVTIQRNDKTLAIKLQHNGQGITTQKVKELANVSTGLGLKSILTRSEVIGATVEFSTPANAYAQVDVRMLLV